MQRFINIILIIFSASTLFAQNIDSKIEKLIELQTEHPDYVTNSQTALMGNLIDYIIKKNHDGKYSSYYVPYTFDTLNHLDKTYYYKTANITTDKKLFYWCFKNEKDNWNLYSLILDSLNNTSANYKMSIISDNEQKIIVFKSHESNFLIRNNQTKKTKRIDYDFDGLKDFDFVYVDTRIENGEIKWSSETNQNIFKDEVLDSLMQELKNNKDGYEKQKDLLDAIESNTSIIKNQTANNKKIYLTSLQVDDVNRDGKIDYYWMAISSGEIIFYKIINFIDSEWMNISDNFDTNLFMKNTDVKKHIELTE